jgi:prepilin-type N-terminal cleavage/methylation domain-containing protein
VLAGINAAKKHDMETQNSKEGEVNQMINNIRNDRSAFTLVEIMIVVAIIGLLAALAVPGFVKARKQSQGRRILNDCRQQDAAIDQWALETGQTDGATVNTTGAQTYLKTTWKTQDLLGNSFGPSTMVVGTGQILISTATKSSLANVGIDWGPY